MKPKKKSDLAVARAQATLDEAKRELKAACRFNKYEEFVSCSLPYLPAEPGHGVAVTCRTGWVSRPTCWQPDTAEQWITTERTQQAERLLARVRDPYYAFWDEAGVRQR